jgi:hypothetical protein
MDQSFVGKRYLAEGTARNSANKIIKGAECTIVHVDQKTVSIEVVARNGLHGMRDLRVPQELFGENFKPEAGRPQWRIAPRKEAFSEWYK